MRRASVQTSQRHEQPVSQPLRTRLVHVKLCANRSHRWNPARREVASKHLFRTVLPASRGDVPQGGELLAFARHASRTYDLVINQPSEW